MSTIERLGPLVNVDAKAIDIEMAEAREVISSFLEHRQLQEIAVKDHRGLEVRCRQGDESGFLDFHV